MCLARVAPIVLVVVLVLVLDIFGSELSQPLSLRFSTQLISPPEEALKGPRGKARRLTYCCGQTGTVR